MCYHTENLCDTGMKQRNNKAFSGLHFPYHTFVMSSHHKLHPIIIFSFKFVHENENHHYLVIKTKPHSSI